MQIIEASNQNRHPTFKRSWRVLPARELIISEIRAQIQCCEVHLHALRKLLDEAVEND